MWFLWSLRQLPSFSPHYWVPYLAAVLLYLLFEGQGGRAIGIEIFALKTAAIGMWCVNAMMRAGMSAVAEEGSQREERLYAQLTLFVVALLIFLPDERSVMLAVTLVYAVAPLLILFIPVMFTPDERKELPYRWLRSEETFAAGYGLLCVREAFFLIVAFWTIGALPDVDWLLWVTAGRVVLHYFYEWLMVLLWAAKRP